LLCLLLFSSSFTLLHTSLWKFFYLPASRFTSLLIRPSHPRTNKDTHTVPSSHIKFWVAVNPGLGAPLAEQRSTFNPKHKEHV
jgi:hypothetical protein